ncbi:hypothetical protein TOPH_04387, partial [Tolypocladium ophioglossoides CBS 100239]
MTALRNAAYDTVFLATTPRANSPKRVPGDATVAHARAHAAHKVRHGLEAAGGDALQRLARLEGDAVARDADLDRLAGARPDVQAGLGVRRRSQLGERREGVDAGGHGGAGGLLVDEHGRRQAREAPVVEVRGAPVVLVGGVVAGRALREVVQQPRLGGARRADDVLEVAAR